MKALALALVALLPMAAATVPAFAAAPTVLITDLSQGQIDINTRFKGADLLVFGAIQYPAGAVPDAPADIAVVVRGPTAPVTVRLKDRVAGIWINTSAVRFETVPGFYAVATTQPIAALADARTTAIYEIGVGNLQLSPVSAEPAETIRRFEAGLIGVKSAAGLFVESSEGVMVTRNVLYRARIAIPAAVPAGDYVTEIHLIRKGRVIASSSTPIVIGKSGFERWVYVMAQEHSLAYGLAAVAAALIAGGIASALTRRR